MFGNEQNPQTEKADNVSERNSDGTLKISGDALKKTLNANGPEVQKISKEIDKKEEDERKQVNDAVSKLASSDTEFKYYLSSKKGLKIVFKPSNKFNGTKTTGLVAAFKNGKLRTNDEKLIKALDQFIKDYPDKGFVISMDMQLEREKRIRELGERELAKEESGKRKGKQGV